MRLLLVSLCLCNVIYVQSQVGTPYNGDSPYVTTYFSADLGDVHNVELRLDYGQYFFLGPEFQNYSIVDHAKTYDPKEYDGEVIPDSGFKDLKAPKKYHEVLLEGQKYKGYLDATVFDADEQEELPVIEKIPEKPLTLEVEGVFGLSFEKKISENRILNKIFTAKKQLIVRRGPFAQKLKKQILEKTKGTLLAGKETLKGCEAFKVVDTVADKGWTVKGDLKIADKTYTNQEFSFSFDGNTYLPQAIHKAHYDNVTDEEDVPEFTVTIGGENYDVEPDNFKYYADEYHEDLKLYVVAHEATNVILGKSFLRDYCIKLSANNALDKTQIGLSVRQNITGDPDFVPFTPPERPTTTTELATTTDNSGFMTIINIFCMGLVLLLVL